MSKQQKLITAITPPTWRWHIKLCTMLRQASAEVGVALACICDENDGLSMAPNKLHDPCAMLATLPNRMSKAVLVSCSFCLLSKRLHRSSLTLRQRYSVTLCWSHFQSHLRTTNLNIMLKSIRM